MQRSTVFVTVLLSLFMFQSFWNVAAAFCAHETVSQYSTLSHLGHHVAEKTHSSEQGAVFDKVAADLPMPLSLQDHHDHLPSCFHVVVTEVQQYVNEPMLHSQDIEQKYYWSNSYQSPHLSGLNPPPVLTPL
ncbi:cation transporter [Acinetobacter sp. C26M]|uniref:cation efflux protein, CzcI-like n=1 Tax=unclassified Acinetobacter TaxID=196816 RepID=UPI001C090D5B|nr:MULTISPECIES: cation efflux protein, CzcI-like [unclassified Acinetobacter]USA46809.1 cation transporter [Acinetobacter sp. C26M]USA50293.1 cation transporter [Acinetobacter sp. C26G]